jgi:hypothetical protein
VFEVQFCFQLCFRLSFGVVFFACAALHTEKLWGFVQNDETKNIVLVFPVRAADDAGRHKMAGDRLDVNPFQYSIQRLEVLSVDIRLDFDGLILLIRLLFIASFLVV